MITTTTADNALKSYYLSAVSDQLNKTTNPFLARIQQTTSDVWGRDVRKTVRYGVNGGIGAGTEEGALPRASGNSYAQFVVTLKNLYGSIEITDKAMRASASGEGAFVDLLNDEMDGLIRSSSYNFGRMLFGDGSGKLATVSSAEASEYTVDTVQYIAEGMIVDVYDGAGECKAEKREVTAVNRAEKKVTLSGDAISTPTGYQIVMQGSKDLEITGLGAIFSDSAKLYGVQRASWMKPYAKAEQGDLTENALQTAIDAVEEQSGSKVNFIICSWGVRRALVKLLSASRSVDTLELEGGFTALSFNGIPVVADRFCPAGTMYLLNTDDFALHQLCDWQWLEGEDGKILKQVPGKPVYTATLVKYAELLCYRPCGQGVIRGITEA